MQLFTGTEAIVQAAIVDDVAVIDDLEAPDVPAIEDAAEGEPEHDEEHIQQVTNARVDTSMTHKWGKFLFTLVERPAKRQWQVTCPYHRDRGDAQGTKCKKTLALTPTVKGMRLQGS